MVSVGDREHISVASRPVARPLRIEFPGALYHVMSRGNERRAIERDDRDREKRLEWFSRTVEVYG